MSSTSTVRRLTVTDLGRLHADGERIPMLTAYDHPTARLVDEAGVPLILVGDSLGQVMLGYESTVRVTMEEIDRKSTRLNSSHSQQSRMPSSA